MSEITVYGAAYSVYVRIVRLVLEEKQQPYRLEEVNVFADEGLPEDYLARHPFGKIPALQHGDMALFETDAITRYLEAVFPSPALLPTGQSAAARVNQLVSVLNNYAYRHMVWGVYVESEKPQDERDRAAMETSLQISRTCLRELQKNLQPEGYLCGPGPTLADFYALPMADYFQRCDTGRHLWRDHPLLADWYRRMDSRDSARRTAFPVPE